MRWVWSPLRSLQVAKCLRQAQERPHFDQEHHRRVQDLFGFAVGYAALVLTSSGRRVDIRSPSAKTPAPRMPEYEPTPEQERILGHDIGRDARVLAGPGTGKSATLVALVDELMDREEPPRLRLLTFTRAATGELAKKVSDHPAAATLRPSTIHSFAISVLVANPGAAEIPQPLRIADTWEERQIVYPTLARRAGVTVTAVRRLIAEMAANWESLRADEDPRVSAADRARFLDAWNEHRRIYGYTLLAELPYELRKALRDHPDLDGVEYDLLIVDEYQDLNACDLEVIKLIGERGCSVIGAGDDDQSIYSGRKAAPEGIRNFLNDYPDADDYTLSITQRCGRRIIEWANYVVAGDPRRARRPELTPAAGSPEGEVAQLAFRGQVAEARGIGQLVKHLVEDEEVEPSDILILLRSDHNDSFSNPIKAQLEAVGIPCSDPDRVDRMLSEEANRRALAVFRVAANREDSLGWSTLLLLTDGIGSSFTDSIYERAREESAQFGRALLAERVAEFPRGPAVSARRAEPVIDQVIEWLDANPPPEEDDIDWGRWMIERAGSGPVPALSDDLRELLLALDELVEADQPLERYLGQIRPLGRDRDANESAGVRIMSMASAKGLTVRATIVAALEEGVIPRPGYDEQEERRFLYVAMTRSKEYLYCTWARRRTGPTARAGMPRVTVRRSPCSFLDGGPVESRDGNDYLADRWGA